MRDPAQSLFSIRLIVVVALCFGAAVTGASAHPGGHALHADQVLRLWHSPETGEPTPGSLLYVSADVAHVEDVAGRLHHWPLHQLAGEDRELATAWRAHVERLNGIERPAGPWRLVPSPLAVESLLPWLALLSCLVGPVIVRASTSPGIPRVLILTFAVGVPLACGGGRGGGAAPTTPTSPSVPTPADVVSLPLASYFASFPGHVRTRQDGQYLYVESDGLADHPMMVGIRSWQQQVPLPQPYVGTNAFSIPLTARLAVQPMSARTALFNGAIALAVNGVPIFNALNNRGDDAFLFGELDEFGGHSGRADDYHYHAAPFTLQSIVGVSAPIAVALDGFPLYGAAEPDGSPLRALDELNGHADAATLYHYHGTNTYPYINGGMRGVVTVVNDHIDPQPSLRPVRPAGTPLNGAVITAFASTGSMAWRVEYRLGGGTYRVDYRIDGSTYTYVFTDPSGASRTESYTKP